MADTVSKQQRSRNMSLIRSKNTKPEMVVRSIVHGLGFRFRLHHSKLPGKPDIVLPRLKKIILVHGCFWHMHNCRRGSVTPKTNTDYWQSKRYRNVERDKNNLTIYQEENYKTLVIWECEIKDIDLLTEKLKTFLYGSN